MQQMLKLQNKCKEGLLEPHFDFLTQGISPNLESLKSLYSVRMKIEELKQALVSNGMHGIFTVPSMMCNDPAGTYNQVPAAGSSPLELFTSASELDLQIIKDWSEYLMLAGEKYLVENLLWSGAKIKEIFRKACWEKNRLANHTSNQTSVF